MFSRGQISLTTALVAVAVVAAAGAGLYVYSSQSSVSSPAAEPAAAVAEETAPIVAEAEKTVACKGGDFSLDGKLSQDDLDEMSATVDGIQANGIPPTDLECADVNGDGFVTSDDESCLIGLITGTITKSSDCTKCEDLGYEICHDGIDNDCDGQTDRETFDNDAGEAYSGDTCGCTAETACAAQYDLDGVPGGEVKWCRDFGRGYNWYTRDEGLAFCNESADKGKKAYCGGQEFTCDDSLAWATCTEKTPCNKTATIGGVKYWCRDMKDAGFKWVKCGKCGTSTLCEGLATSYDTYSAGDYGTCDDIKYVCADTGWKGCTVNKLGTKATVSGQPMLCTRAGWQPACDETVPCTETKTLDGKTMYCRDFGDGWYWQACATCDGKGCSGVSGAQAYSPGAIGKCASTSVLCQDSGVWAACDSGKVDKTATAGGTQYTCKSTGWTPLESCSSSVPCTAVITPGGTWKYCRSYDGKSYYWYDGTSVNSACTTPKLGDLLYCGGRAPYICYGAWKQCGTTVEYMDLGGGETFACSGGSWSKSTLPACGASTNCDTSIYINGELNYCRNLGINGYNWETAADINAACSSSSKGAMLTCGGKAEFLCDGSAWGQCTSVGTTSDLRPTGFYSCTSTGWSKATWCEDVTSPGQNTCKYGVCSDATKVCGYKDSTCQCVSPTDPCVSGLCAADPSVPGCSTCWTSTMKDSNFCNGMCKSHPTSSTCSSCWTTSMKDTKFCTAMCGATSSASGCSTCWTDDMKDSEFCRDMCKNNPSATGCSTCWTNDMKSTNFCYGICNTDPDNAVCSGCWTDSMKNTAACSGLCKKDPNGPGCSTCWTNSMKDSGFCKEMCKVSSSASGCSTCWTDSMKNSQFCNGMCAANPSASGCSTCWTDSMKDTPFCKGICEADPSASGCSTCWTDDMKNTPACRGYCASHPTESGCSTCWTTSMKDTLVCEGLCKANPSDSNCNTCWTSSMKDSLVCKCMCAGDPDESGCSTCWTDSMKDSWFCNGMCVTDSHATGCSTCWTSDMKNTKFCSSCV